MSRSPKFRSVRLVALAASFAASGVAATLGASGCASSQPPRELASARIAYQRAAMGPAAQVTPADLHVAGQTLREAERVFADEGDSQATRDIAYTAEQRVHIAEARARSTQAMQQRSRAIGQIESARAQQLQTTSAELSRTREQLQAEEQGHAEAEKRAEDAIAALSKVGSVRRDPRGTVITLSGSVLFASGQSQLLPSAMNRLKEVATALSTQGAKNPIVVEGHTDSQGSDAINQPLSLQRAQNVRDFLVKNGVDADRIRAEGAGASNPIASNLTAEGRANNRRVEIVVQSANGSSTPGDTTTPPSSTPTPPR